MAAQAWLKPQRHLSLSYAHALHHVRACEIIAATTARVLLKGMRGYRKCAQGQRFHTDWDISRSFFWNKRVSFPADPPICLYKIQACTPLQQIRSQAKAPGPINATRQCAYVCSDNAEVPTPSTTTRYRGRYENVSGRRFTSLQYATERRAPQSYR